jgi:hypothetical protein
MDTLYSVDSVAFARCRRIVADAYLQLLYLSLERLLLFPGRCGLSFLVGLLSLALVTLPHGIIEQVAAERDSRSSTLSLYP